MKSDIKIGYKQCVFLYSQKLNSEDTLFLCGDVEKDSA